MRQFLKRVGLFAAVQATLAFLVIYARTNPEGYFGAFNDKLQRLRSTTSPRIIFVGGSSAAFSLDSLRIERELGLTPVNLGLALPLGLEFMLREVPVSTLQYGDVIVLNLEYEHFWTDALAAGDLFGVIRVCPTAVRYLNGHSTKLLLDEALPLFTAELRKGVARAMGGKQTDPLMTRYYCRHAFNEYGDCVAQWDSPCNPEATLMMPEPVKAIPSRLDQVINTLNRFESRCHQRGVRVFLEYPAFPEPLFCRHTAEIQRIDDALRERLRIPILNRPEMAVGPTALFFDNRYHLIRSGVEWHTSEVINELKSHLAVFSRRDPQRRHL